MPIPKPDPKMLDDLARMAGGAVNIFSGLQDQIRNDIRARVDEMATKLDLVPRDELDQAKGMIEKLRQEVKGLSARLDNIEGKKPSNKKAPPPTAGKAKAKVPGRKPSPKHKKK